MHKKLFFILFTLVASGCSSLAVYNWDALFGTADPTRFDSPPSGGSVSFQQQVKPILDKRCVVCHACYDAPCQLKLGSYEGITRGANSNYIYNSSRLLAETTTRLHLDAELTSEWRNLDFFPVLNERDNTPGANIAGSVLAQMLIQKQQHPLPKKDKLPQSFDFKLHRDQQCTDIESFAHYKRDYPLWGMPYGLPALSNQQHDTLIKWIEEGAPVTEQKPLDKKWQAYINQWEGFFNQDSLKAQLMSRYMYEHLFPAHLYFEDSDQPVFFEIVRSATPPGQKIQIIATRRPYDDPKVERVYYRIRPIKDTVVLKTHMPYLLSQSRMAKWHTWFLNDDYQVDHLPSYEVKKASNPFLTFAQIPSYARYRFMLEEAQYTIMGFIKSPVCRGHVALNVINDHFWVTFTHPKLRANPAVETLLQTQIHNLDLPAEASSSAGLLNWINYARQEKRYAEAKAQTMNEQVNKSTDVTLDMLWDGDGENDNAALTIFRHYDSATVIKGLHGNSPQTAWVVTYPLLERIHYLLVAGFDVFGNVGHQLNTRIYMDFLRMEGEFNFLALLPKDHREQVRSQWYQGSPDRVKEYVYEAAKNYQGETSIVFNSNNPLTELYQMLQAKLAPVLNREYHISHGFNDATTLDHLDKLSKIRGLAASLMPQTSLLELVDSNNDESEYYSISSNSAYTNISYLFGEANRRQPHDDSLTISYGVLGAYPNSFLRVDKAELAQFVDRVSALQSQEDYIELLNKWAIRRSSDEFWSFSDRAHADFQSKQPVRFGLLDYNRLDNQ